MANFFKNIFTSSAKKTAITTQTAAPWIPQFSLFHTAGGNIYAIPLTSISTILSNYNTIAPLDIAVNRVASSVASLPISLIFNETGEPDDELPPAYLLRYPNSTFQKTRHEFFRDLAISYLLDGQAAIRFSGAKRPFEMVVLPPASLTYQYESDSSYYPSIITHTDIRSTQYRFDPDAGLYHDDSGLLHLHYIPQTLLSTNTLYGRSSIIALQQEISQYLFASGHNISLLQNGLRPSGAFMARSKNGVPAVFSDEQFNRLKQEVTESYSGASNAGRPLFIEGDLEWVEMSLKPKDLDFAQLKDQAEQKIYQTLGVPIQLIMDAKTTANNLQSFRLEFYENRVLPLGDLFCEHLSKTLLPPYQMQFSHSFQIDRDNIDVLISRRIEKQKALETSTVYTINEKRAKLKLPPIEDGDKIVDPNGRPIAGKDAPITTAPVPEAPIAPLT